MGKHTEKILIVWIVLVTLLAAFLFNYFYCGSQAKYKEVSYDERYAYLIGRKYRSITELLIYGITTDRNYKKQIDYYVIMNAPGISGPEVLSKAYLKPGLVIQIQKALKCTNCLDTRIKFQVEILSEAKYHDQEIVIENVKKNDVVGYKNGKAVINSEVFEDEDEDEEMGSEMGSGPDSGP